MLHGIKDLIGFELAARDGSIGHVKEAYFDDRHWVVRHLVVVTGGWLAGRRVLISPHSVLRVDRAERRLEVTLTRAQIENAPDIDTDKPVSRQHEIATYDHYRYPYYWGGGALWGMFDAPLAGAIAPLSEMDPEVAREVAEAERDSADPNLRSSAEVAGYAVAARDGEIGHVDDFLFDEASWQIKLVVVDTHNWLPDRLVLVPPLWVAQVDWTRRRAVVRVDRKVVEASPPYTRNQALSTADLDNLQRHFEGQPPPLSPT